MNKAIKLLREDISKAFFDASNSKDIPVFENFYNTYFRKSDWKKINNRVLSSLALYNSHVCFISKKKHYRLSNTLIDLLKKVSEKHGLNNTSATGLIDCLSDAILKQSMIDDSLKNDVQFNEFIMEHCEKFLFFDFNKSIQNNVNILRIFIRRFKGFNSEYFDELKEWRARYEILELEQEMLKEAQINTNTIRINKF